MINPVPERTINYRVYDETNALYGIATVDLPDIESMSDTISGAGIAGEVESPTLGHFGTMEIVLNWRTITPEAARLSAPRAHHLELRGSQQIYDAGMGEIHTQAVRIVTRSVPKNLSLGSFEVGATSDSASTFEVNFLKIYLGGRPSLEIDKYNFIFAVNGVDYLANVRRDMGMG